MNSDRVGWRMYSVSTFRLWLCKSNVLPMQRSWQERGEGDSRWGDPCRQEPGICRELKEGQWPEWRGERGQNMASRAS